MSQRYSGFVVTRTLGFLLAGGALALSLALPAAAASSPAFNTNWIRANGVSLRYELFGQGPSTIVLLHEGSMGLESWDYVAPEPADQPEAGAAHARRRGSGGQITAGDEAAAAACKPDDCSCPVASN